jgi:hypothetical protein
VDEDVEDVLVEAIEVELWGAVGEDGTSADCVSCSTILWVGLMITVDSIDEGTTDDSMEIEEGTEDSIEMVEDGEWVMSGVVTNDVTGDSEMIGGDGDTPIHGDGGVTIVVVADEEAAMEQVEAEYGGEGGKTVTLLNMLAILLPAMAGRARFASPVGKGIVPFGAFGKKVTAWATKFLK